MKDMFFDNPNHNPGPNLTVRKGRKWVEQNGKEVNIKGLGVRIVRARACTFATLKDADLTYEHDPECRTKAGLLDVLQYVYPGFDMLNTVTLVEYSGHNYVKEAR